MYNLEDDDVFLCKCLNLLYLIKELILSGLSTNIGTGNVLIYNFFCKQFAYVFLKNKPVVVTNI